jgi:hypothetical protein
LELWQEAVTSLELGPEGKLGATPDCQDSPPRAFHRFAAAPAYSPARRFVV